MSAEPDRQKPNVTLAVLSIGGLAYALLQSLVAPALPDIQRSLHASENGVSWVFTAYLLAASVGTPILGRLGDMYGKERWLILTLLGLAAGTLLAAVAPSLPVLIAARIVQGFGGGIFPLAFGIVRDEFPRERVAGAIGLLSGIMGFGAGLGVVLAGPLADGLGWHWLFWLPLVAILLATVLTWRLVPESPMRMPGRINWLAALLMVSGISAILIALSETTAWGWGSPRTLLLVAAGLAVVGTWIAVELRSQEPLVDMRMMRLRAVWTTNLSAFLLGAGMYTSFVVIPQFVETPRSHGFGFGASVTGGGIFLLPTTVLVLILSVLAGRVAARFGSRRALIAGSALAAAGYALLLVEHSAPAPIYVASGVLGAGIGLAFSALGALIVSAVPAHQTGVAAGMNTVLRTLGGALGAQLAATFIAGSTRAGEPTVHGYQLAFVVMTVAVLLAVVASAAVPRRPRGASPAPAPALAAQEA